MTLSARLWAANSDLAQRALVHPFVLGLADGSLPPERYAAFIAQDVFFLDAFARAYALALVRAPDTATLLTLADLIGGVRAELGSHLSTGSTGGVDGPTTAPTPTFCSPWPPPAKTA